MKISLPLIMLILSTTFAYGARFQSRIESIEEGSGETPHLVFFQNGHVAFLDEEDKEFLPYFQQGLDEKSLLDITVDNRNSLESVSTLDSGSEDESEAGVYTEKQSFEPTIISPEEAVNVFQRMRRNYQYDSQCYNRAHIWAYEEWKRSSLNSIKLFMFFTRSYIRKYRYHWWFHVSPMVKTHVGEKVLDRRFTKGPLDVKVWTDVFIYSKRACAVVSRYSDYRDNQETEDCYLIPVSMYHWQPRDIDAETLKTEYIRSEVNWAYREAF